MITSAESAGPVAYASFLPIAIISGVFDPTFGGLPRWLSHAVALFPVKALAQMLEGAYTARPFPVVDFANLVLWTGAGSGFAAWRFPLAQLGPARLWLPSAASPVASRFRLTSAAGPSRYSILGVMGVPIWTVRLTVQSRSCDFCTASGGKLACLVALLALGEPDPEGDRDVGEEGGCRACR